MSWRIKIMKRIFLLLPSIVLLAACESEKIPYHCGIGEEVDGSIGDLASAGKDAILSDIKGYTATYEIEDIKLYDIILTDTSTTDVYSADATVSDIISGRPCSKIGVSDECGIDESCYPFVECGGICRRCGSGSVGSDCEIHSDCKCQMACLSIGGRGLRCYKICNSNLDCPTGQTCTDGWGSLYEHEYFKICLGNQSGSATTEGSR